MDIIYILSEEYLFLIYILTNLFVRHFKTSRQFWKHNIKLSLREALNCKDLRKKIIIQTKMSILLLW